MSLIREKILSRVDWGFLLSLCMIPLCGLVVLYSAGYDPDGKIFTLPLFGIVLESPTFIRQWIFLGIGSIAFLVGAFLPSSFIQKVSYPIYVVCVLVLIVLLGYGDVSKGARRWFDLGIIKFQPAETMKLGLILALSQFLSKSSPERGGFGFKDLFIPALMVGVPMLLIIKQPDLGTALSVGAIGAALILFLGVKKKVLITCALVAAIAAPVAWNLLHDYQKRRILVLIDPQADPLGSGYHIIQSKIAVGSGGLLGKGFLEGTQSQLEFLPEHTTDFIFSVLAEEFGFVGGVTVLFLYVVLLYRMLRIVSRTNDLHDGLLAFGVVGMVFFHVIINIGMVLGLFPVVGIPLPLFSYGGSSLLSTMFCMGLVMGVAMRRFAYR